MSQNEYCNKSRPHGPFVHSDSNQSRNGFHPRHSLSLTSLSAVRGLPKVDDLEFLFMLILRSTVRRQEVFPGFS